MDTVNISLRVMKVVEITLEAFKLGLSTLIFNYNFNHFFSIFPILVLLYIVSNEKLRMETDTFRECLRLN